MKKNFWIALGLVIFLSILLMGYGVYVNYAGESSISERMYDRALSVTGSVARVRSMKADYMIEETKLEARQAVDVIAKTNGVIKKTLLHKNKRVYPGDVVAIMENEELSLKIISASSDIKKAQAELVRAKNTYERHAKLIEQDATSYEKLDEAKAMYDAAIANVEDAQARYEQAVLEENRLRVVSPTEGSAVIIYKQEGSFITAGTPIFMIADFDSMWFSVNMPEYEIRALLGNEGKESTFTMTPQSIGHDKAYNTEYAANNMGYNSKFNVTINGIYPDLDVPADMRRVVFDVDNRMAILEPHSYNYLKLTANTPRDVLCVAARAIYDKISNDNKQYVYVVSEDGRLEKREVSVGAVNSEYAEILSGLEEGEIAVSSGVEGLTVGQKITVNNLEDN